MLSRFHLIPERHGRTDGQMDRIAISILRVSVLTRDKNRKFLLTRFMRTPSAVTVVAKFGENRPLQS